MRSREWRLTIAAAAANLATLLFFLFPMPAQAFRGDLQADPLHEARQRKLAAVDARKRTVSVVENPRICGKCHSTCEPGRTHGGQPASAHRETFEFPLTADGRVTCLTCHQPHRDGAAAADGGLRIPNVRRELCLACHPTTTADAPTIEILSPPERALVAEERLALIGRLSAPGKGRHLTVRLNDITFHVLAEERDFVTWLTLREGINRCEIALGDRILWSGEIFHGVGTANGYRNSTVGHLTGSQRECKDCHDSADGRVARAEERNSVLCYECHERLEGKRYLHGPLGIGACLACHDPHGGYGTAHLRDEQSLLCGKCHAAREIATASACTPTGRGCTDCHDPHQSDTRYLLKGPKYTLLYEAQEGR